MRMISKPSTANCNLGDYVCYLLSEPLSANYSRLGKVMSITHDSVNFGIANNRKISLERGRQQQVQTLDIPPQGDAGYLPQFGYVTVFQQKFKEESRYYIVCLPKLAEGESEPTFNSVSRKDFENLHNTHWGIEQFHVQFIQKIPPLSTK